METTPRNSVCASPVRGSSAAHVPGPPHGRQEAAPHGVHHSTVLVNREGNLSSPPTDTFSQFLLCRRFRPSVSGSPDHHPRPSSAAAAALSQDGGQYGSSSVSPDPDLHASALPPHSDSEEAQDPRGGSCPQDLASDLRSVSCPEGLASGPRGGSSEDLASIPSGGSCLRNHSGFSPCSTLEEAQDPRGGSCPQDLASGPCGGSCPQDLASIPSGASCSRDQLATSAILRSPSNYGSCSPEESQLPHCSYHGGIRSTPHSAPASSSSSASPFHSNPAGFSAPLPSFPSPAYRPFL